MGYNIAFQLASLGIVLYMIIMFVFMKRLPTRSGSLFYALLLTTAACLMTDAFSNIFVHSRSEHAPFLADVANTAYIAMLGMISYIVFLYIRINTDEKINLSLKSSLSVSVPFIVCTGLVIFSPSDVQAGEVPHFYYGLQSYFCIICGAFYIAMSFFLLAKNSANIAISTRRTYFLALIIESAAATAEFLFPPLYVASYAATLVCICLFLAVENPSATVEPFSGLFNKNGFISFLRYKFAEKRPFSIVFIHMEDFKRISSTFSMSEADSHVSQIARNISKIRSGTVFLNKSDEICIILDCDEERAVEQAYNISFYLNRPCTISSMEYVNEYHIGVFSCPAHAGCTDDVFKVISYTLAHARTGKINTVTVFDTELVERQKRQLQIQTILREAVAGDGFLVFYQPIYSAKTREIVSAEALLRLKDHSIGYIGPDEFIPIAESNGLIIPIGMHVFELVCRFVSEHRLFETGISFLEINLSGVQCMQNDLAERLFSTIERYGIPTSFINLEITETAAMKSSETLLSNMNRIISYGSSFSLDDFGSGYSNLQYIVNFPFSFIKLDKCIVWAYFEDRNKKAKVILESSIEMMKKLELKIIAEGVETAEQAQTLTDMGVDFLQGFHFSKPIPAELFLRKISEGKV